MTDEELKEHGFEVRYLSLGREAVIELDWFRPDQDWRSFRLHRVAGHLRAVVDATGDYSLIQKLARIHDHKGELTCYWNEPPTDAEKEVVKNAWDAECEDGEFIEHEMEERE